MAERRIEAPARGVDVLPGGAGCSQLRKNGEAACAMTESRALVPIRNGRYVSANGRTSDYNVSEILEEVCWRMEHGATLISICRVESNGRERGPGEFPSHGLINRWADPYSDIYQGEEFKVRFARAKLDQQRYWIEETVDIANTPEPGFEEIVEHSSKNGVSIRRARKDMLAHRALKIDTRLKLVAKMNPQMWSDRLQGSDNAPTGDSEQKLIVNGGLPPDGSQVPGED